MYNDFTLFSYPDGNFLWEVCVCMYAREYEWM